MPRSRNIKPGFFRNEHLAELPFEARLLFIGLWTLADKAGRLEDRPRKIKIEVFPADDVDVPCMLHALTMHGFITRYKVEGTPYIQINNFLKHQSPHHKEPESELPGLDKADADDPKTNEKTDGSECTSHASTMHEPSTPHASDKKITSSPLIPDSGFLIPDSSKNPCAPDNAPTTEKAEALYSEDFTRFWNAYPSKKGKKPAALKFRVVRKKHPSPEFLDRLIEDVQCRARGYEWTKSNGQFIPMASTYLNQERWNDPAPNVSSIQGRHVGFNERDYTEGLKEASNGESNF